MYRILVVEDEEFLRHSFIASINWGEFDCMICAEAKDGKEGLAAIEAYHPHIVFTDVRMPVMSGLEMLQLSKEQYHYEAVVISGYGEFDYVKQALSVGAAEYLLKPVDRREVRALMTRLVARIHERLQVQPLPEFLLGELPETASPYTKSCIRFLIDHYADKISNLAVAEELQISPDYLNRVFKGDTGCTIRDYLTHLRIEQACQLFRHPAAYRVYEVAEMVGFPDYKYFHQIFTREKGVSPSAYKKNCSM